MDSANFEAIATLSLEEERDEAAALPRHLVGLPGTREWAFWRWVAVRSAGFPAEEVLKLANPECAEAADRIFKAEEEARSVRHLALENVNKALDELRAASEWDDKAKRGPLLNALHSLKAGGLPDTHKLAGRVRIAIEALHETETGIATAASDFRRAYEEASVQTSLAIVELLESERLREAIIWQNRRAFHTGVGPLLRSGSEPEKLQQGYKRQQKEQMVASYVQRYFVKNDTIGFFGPVGWARLVDSGAAIEARPGPTLLSRRSVYFESWSIDAIAELFSQKASYRKWAPPRLLPYYYVEGTTLYQPGKLPISLSFEHTAVLRACDGSRPACEIASELVLTPDLRLTTDDDVYALLEYASDQGLITWAFECRLEPKAEQNLREQFERIEDGPLRDQALSVLDQLEAARGAVASAAGNADAVDRALGELEEKFRALSGVASTRNAGAMYAGRTVVYEDCQRDLEMELGPELLEGLAAPFQLLLTSARWFTFEAAKVYRQLFKESYDALAAGGSTVDGVSFWRKVQPALLDEKKVLINTCVTELQKRWSEVLALDPEVRSVVLRSRDLLPLVESTFAAPAAGWSLARYHSPDVMIAARSVDDIRRGNCQFVLGELHLGFNTLITATFAEQHPAPEELFAAIEADLPDPCVVPIPPRHMAETTTRTTLSLVPEKDYRLALSYDSAGYPLSQTLPIASLVIDGSFDQLIARTRDGRLQFDLVELFGGVLSVLTAAVFRLLAPSRHTPRVTVDNLVMQREAWGFGAAELSWVWEKSEAGRFAGARRWAHEFGLPRHVFAKVSGERKPLYVDMQSSVLLEVFGRAVRRTKKDAAGIVIEVTEMLPGLDGAWLQDAEGRLYTSEFRFVTVDLGSQLK